MTGIDEKNTIMRQCLIRSINQLTAKETGLVWLSPSAIQRQNPQCSGPPPLYSDLSTRHIGLFTTPLSIYKFETLSR